MSAILAFFFCSVTAILAANTSGGNGNVPCDDIADEQGDIESSLPANVIDANQRGDFGQAMPHFMRPPVMVHEMNPPVQYMVLEPSSLAYQRLVTFRCVADAYPEPKYEWQYFYDGKVYKLDLDAIKARIVRSTTNGTITFIKTLASDAKEYRCKASNRNGTAFSAWSQLKAANFPPKSILNENVAELAPNTSTALWQWGGGQITLTCTFLSSPRIMAVEWYRLGVPMQIEANGNRVQNYTEYLGGFVTRGRLVFNELEYGFFSTNSTDDGTFRCIGRTAHFPDQQAYAQFELTVYRPWWWYPIGAGALATGALLLAVFVFCIKKAAWPIALWGHRHMPIVKDEDADDLSFYEPVDVQISNEGVGNGPNANNSKSKIY